MIINKVKINKKLNQDILRTVRNYNAKITRLTKSGKTNVFIPAKIKVSDFKTQDTSSQFYSYTNAELRQHLRDLKRYLKRGAEEYTKTKSGIKISNYERDLLTIRRRKAIKRINEELEDYGRLHLKSLGGNPEPFSFRELGDLKYRNLLARKNYLQTNKLSNISSTKLRYYRKFVSAYSRPSRDEVWKSNYLEILKINAKSLGIEDDVLDKVISELDTLTPYEFKIAFNEDKYLQAMYDYYLQWKSNQIDSVAADQAKERFETLSLNVKLVVQDARETARTGRIKY